MATYKSNFFTALNTQADQIKKDGNWKYAQSTTGYTFDSARAGKRTGNCAHYVNWALRKAKMLPAKGWFYLKDGGAIAYQGTAEQKAEMEKYIKKFFTIKKVNGTLKTLDLKKGDILGFKGMTHTCVYDSYDATKKKYLMWDGGSAANVNGIKLNCHLYKTSYPYPVAVILRPKTFYYPKYTGKSSSIVDALNSLGIDSSMTHRKAIAANNGIANYSGTAAQNTVLLDKLKAGKLIKN